MDELLFISMARLGADRLRAEREKSTAAGVESHFIDRQRSAARPDFVCGNPTGNPLLAVVSLALAIALTVSLGAAAVSSWHPSAVDTAPPGEVYITELGRDADVSLQLAQREARASSTR